MAALEEHVQRRRRRYMAKLLDEFDENIAPHLPPAANGNAQAFKGAVREHMNALATDSTEAAELVISGMQRNGVAIEALDRI